MRRTSSEKLFQDLGQEILKPRRWFRKLCFCYELFHNESPGYLFKLIPDISNSNATSSAQKNQITLLN